MSAFEEYGLFFGVPWQMRSKIIEKMGAVERSRLARCSLDCDEEVRESIKYIHSLEFHACSSQYLRIMIHYDKTAGNTCQLVFVEKDNQKHMRYENRNGELWRTVFTPETNLVQEATKKFEQLLTTHQKSIRGLVLGGEHFRWSGLRLNLDNVRQFRRLESLEIKTKMDTDYIAEKLWRPLQIFTHFWSNGHDKLALTANQLSLERAQLNFNQFLNLSANKIEMNIGQMDQWDIIDFIELWQRGQVRESFQKCCWTWFSMEKFCVDKIFNIFGNLNRADDTRKRAIIHSKKHSGLWAELYSNIDSNYIMFQVGKKMNDN